MSVPLPNSGSIRHYYYNLHSGNYPVLLLLLFSMGGFLFPAPDQSDILEVLYFSMCSTKLVTQTM